MKKLKKTDFKRLMSDVYYFYRFTRNKKHYEICLEPCMNGFEVGLYERYGARHPEIVRPKVCTNELGYDTDIFGIQDRSSKTWDNALNIAWMIVNMYFGEEKV